MPSTENDSSCPLCGGTGWCPEEASNAVRRCVCSIEKEAEARLRQARIPARYQHCTLNRSDKFGDRPVDVFEGYHPYNESQVKAKMYAEKFVEAFPDVDGGLLFVGGPGVGKTHLAVAILRSLIKGKGVRGLFYDFRDLLREIQHSWNPVSQSSELEVLRPVLETELLVLDELGANKPSDWVRDTVTHIINSRYNDKRITIFTSNFPDREGEASPRGSEASLMRREESLTDRVGDRLRSRLYEMCTLIKIEGEDFRKMIRRDGLAVVSDPGRRRK